MARNDIFETPHWDRHSRQGDTEERARMMQMKEQQKIKDRLETMKNEALKELDELQGMGNVKDTILESVSLAQTFKAREKFGLKNEQHALHMVFTGNAGTGKTTVARIVGKIFVGAGLLNKGDYEQTVTDTDGSPFSRGRSRGEVKDVPFVECTNADISSAFWGEDEKRMKQKFDQANGGVLFIDEAYSMISRSGHRSGEKVSAVMVAEMENRRDSVCVIGAGYPNEMEEFLQYNEGLASRFATVVHFDNYDVKTLLTIADSMAKDRDYVLTEDYRTALGERLSKERLMHSFGNARTVRNIIEQSIRKHAKRVNEKYGSDPSREVLTKLTKDDLEEFNPIFTGEKIDDPYLALYNEGVRNGIISGGKVKKYREKRV